MHVLMDRCDIDSEQKDAETGNAKHYLFLHTNQGGDVLLETDHNNEEELVLLHRLIALPLSDVMPPPL